MNATQTGMGLEKRIATRRYVYIVFIILFCLLLVELSKIFFVTRIGNDWSSIRMNVIERESELIEDTFGRVQSRVAGLSHRAARIIRGMFSGAGGDVTDTLGYFRLLEEIDLAETEGIEFHDRDGKLIAWEGKIPDRPDDDLESPPVGGPASRITQGTILTTLTVVVPVENNSGGTLGFLSVHEIIDMQYTLSPRFFRMSGLQDKLRDKLGRAVQLRFRQSVSQDEDRFTVPLRGVDGALLGYAIVPDPTLESYLAEVESHFHMARNFLVLVLSGLIIVISVKVLRAGDFPALLVTGTVAGLWILRYVWMKLSIPAVYVGNPLFDPAYYASPLGGGLVQTPGDLLISAICLLCTSLLLFHSVTIMNSLRIPERLPRHTWWWTGLICIVLFLIYMGLVRTYAAGVRSLVFDSSVRFSEPGSIFPSPMLAVMQFNLLAMTASFALLGTVLGSIGLRLSKAVGYRNINSYIVTTGASVIIAVTIFYLLSRNPLIGFWYYLGVPIFLLTITVLVQRGHLQAFRLYRIRSILFLTGLAVLLAIPVLDKQIHELDREQVQVIAGRTVRPTDAWKEFLLQQSLIQLSTDETLIRALSGGWENYLERSAFRLWAQSLLSREGYNAGVFVFDEDDRPISEFTIGFQSMNEDDLKLSLQAIETQATLIRQFETLYGRSILYGGRAGIFDGEGARVGSISVCILTGPGTLFRGYTPDLLLTEFSGDITARYGQFILSEFEGNRLIATSAPTIPAGHTIPARVLQRLESEASAYFWESEYIEGEQYQTLYFKTPEPSADLYYAISMMQPDLRWHVFYALKLIFLALIVCTLILILAGAYFYTRGKRYRPTFREMILIGLLSISLVPIIIVAYFNREFTVNQITETASQQLYEETKRVSLRLEKFLGENSRMNRNLTEQIASELGIDLILYREGKVSSTSRRDLVEADLLDKRLSGYAYAHLVLQGKNFITREQVIGLSSFLVGYRPLYSDGGNLFGILAIPAIYRQTEINAELARRDAFLFGIYALVIGAVVFAGTLVANKIARPIEVLTEATNRVAGGELDITLESRGENEISILMRSFSEMTRKLKENREQLARIEREMAWREMARQVAHEIKNPLTPMKLSIQQLRQEKKDRSRKFSEVFDAVTRMLLEQIATLDRISSEFSRFARLPVSNYEAVDVNEVLYRAAALFRQKSDVDFQLNFDDTVPVINADAEELQRAFVNVIRNGIQAIPGKGTLRITTTPENGRIRIIISDSGIGLSPEARARLFEPNFSTKTDGMGLGLAIVKKTIDELQGTIEIESTMHVGTTVVILLPAIRSYDQQKARDSNE